MVLSPSQTEGAHAAIREAGASLPQGSSAPVRVMLSHTISAYTTPCASPTGTLRFRGIALIRSAFAVRERLGATHGTFPTFAAVLSMRAIDHIPAVHCAIPLCSRSDSRLPRYRNESPPATSVSTSNTRRRNDFGTASFALCYGPHVCLALLAGYDAMKSHVLHPAF